MAHEFVYFSDEGWDGSRCPRCLMPSYEQPYTGGHYKDDCIRWLAGRVKIMENFIEDFDDYYRERQL